MATALSQMFLSTSKLHRNVTITFLLKATIVNNLDQVQKNPIVLSFVNYYLVCDINTVWSVNDEAALHCGFLVFVFLLLFKVSFVHSSWKAPKPPALAGGCNRASDPKRVRCEP